MSSPTQNKKISLFEIALFGIFGGLMFGTKMLMELLPNIHLLGMFIVTFTVVFRVKALIPIYVYVFLEGIFSFLSGVVLWWLPYLYIWAVLWGAAMLIPKKIPKKIACFVYPVVCALHGLAFGTLYAPAQALMFGLDFKGTLTWIIAGLPFDLIHAVSNFIAGLLILPLSELLKKLLKNKEKL
ncbi:MAG: hypothetical protein KBS52_05265 [Clostridiales bacterium]|nr:hypothetical protein [Candidatus Equinaster intestinalis]